MAPFAGYPKSFDSSAPSAKKPFFFWLTLALGVAFVIMYGYSGWMVLHYEPATTSSGWWQELREGAGWVPTIKPDGAAAEKLQVVDLLPPFTGDARANTVGTQIYQ